MQPFKHQADGLAIMRQRPRFGFFWKPGTGKTALILFRQREAPKRTLVLAQKSIIWTAWEQDAKELGVPLRVVWSDKRAERLRLIREPGDHVLVTNYEQFKMHAADLMESGVQRLVIDESSKVKNRKSKIAQAMVRFADRMQEVYILTGTPAPNCDTELWSQMRIVSSASVGAEFYGWAYRWFYPETQNIRGRTVVKRWHHKPGTQEAFIDSLRNWSWSLRKEECIDLPAATNQLRRLELGEDEQRVYKQIEDECRATLPGDTGDGGEVLVRAEAVAMKLRQVVGGAVVLGPDRVEYGSTKLDDLCEFLDEVGPDEPVVIWAEFTANIDRIRRAVDKRGESIEVVDGRSSNRVSEIVQRFVSGQVKRLVCHPKAAGHGTNGLQKVCRYAYYFDLSYSADEHEQSRDRIHRAGQQWPCTYVYPIATGTVDEDMLRVVHRKTTRQNALMRLLGRIRGVEPVGAGR